MAKTKAKIAAPRTWADTPGTYIAGRANIDGADVEFAQHGVEHAFAGGGLDLLDHGLRRADEGEIVLTKVVDIDRMTRDLGAAGIAAFGVVFRQSEITDPTVSSGAENPGETVFEVGFCFRHGLGVGLVNID